MLELLANPAYINLVRAMECLPAWLTHDQMVGVLATWNASPTGDRLVFARVPSDLVVVQDDPFGQFVADSRSTGGMRGISYNLSRKHRLGEDVILYPKARPDIQFLELGLEELHKLLSVGEVQRHWARGRAAAFDTKKAGQLKHLGQQLRCLRPPPMVDAMSPLSRDGYFASGLEEDERYATRITLDEVFVRVDDVEEIRGLAPKRPDDDPYGLFNLSPAIYQLFALAKKYSDPLKLLSKTGSGKGHERRIKLEQDIEKSLARFGKPFNTDSAKKLAMRLIDPKASWDQGNSKDKRRRSVAFAMAQRAAAGSNEALACDAALTDPLKRLIQVTIDAQPIIAEIRARRNEDELGDSERGITILNRRIQLLLKAEKFRESELATLTKMIRHNVRLRSRSIKKYT